MARKRVIPVRFSDQELSLIDLAIERWQSQVEGVRITRSEFLRLAAHSWWVREQESINRKRKGKVACYRCGKKAFPRDMAILEQLLDGQSVYTCSACAGPACIV